jgi:long-subunit fatty acid transport protein
MLRSGVRFKQPRWDVEADFVWERWAGFGRLEIKPTDITYTLSGPEPNVLPSIFQDRGYGDAYSIRVGGDVEVVPGLLTVRAGYFFEMAAVPTQSLSLNLVDTDKHGFGIGFTLRYRWFTFSAAYSHIQLAERQVLDSNARQINLLYIGLDAQEQAPVVGRGVYRAGWDNLVFGIGIDIDTLVGWTRPQR